MDLWGSLLRRCLLLALLWACLSPVPSLRADDGDEGSEEGNGSEAPEEGRPKKCAPRPEGPNLALPAELSPIQRKLLVEAISGFKTVRDGEGKGGALRSAIRKLERCLGDNSKLPVLHYYLGQAYQLKRNFSRARSHLERATKANPEFHEAQMELGDVCVWEREPAKAIAFYDKAIAIAPKNLDAWMRKSQTYVRLGKFNEALQSLSKARDLDPNDPDILVYQMMIRVETKGPEWKQTFTKETDNYIVQTSVSQEIADEAAARAELILKAYKRLFPSIKRPERKYPIIIFENREAYMRGGGPPMAGGHYSPLVRKLVLFRYPKKDDTFIVLQHEAFHQFLHDYTETAPQWFNEGLGDYYGAFAYEKKGGKETLRIRPNPWRVGGIKFAIQANYCPSAEELMTMTREEMYSGRAGIHYAQAWSLIYFMFETASTHKYDKVLVAYFKALMAGKDIEDAFDATFGKIDMTEFELRWRNFVTGMKER